MLLLILVTVYVVLGNFYDHTGLIVAMDEMDLFENGKYDFSSTCIPTRQGLRFLYFDGYEPKTEKKNIVLINCSYESER